MMRLSVVRLLCAVFVIAGPLAGQTAARPAQGDFDVGDQILLEVEGDTQFTHAFNVGPGPALTLPVIGAIPLAGVRRGDVEGYLTQQLARYMRNPMVHAKVLVRLGVLGEVEHPGFYALPSSAVVSDALMAAGGPTREAKFTAARVEREGNGLFVGGAFQDALTRGLTIDGMGLHTGDRIVVPRRNDTERTIRIVGILVSIPIAVLGIRQLTRSGR